MSSNFRKTRLAACLLAASMTMAATAEAAPSRQAGTGPAPNGATGYASESPAFVSGGLLKSPDPALTPGIGAGGSGPIAANAYAAAPAGRAPQAKTGQPLHIVAVGDSLTVGYEHGMALDSVPYGYADRVYEQALYHGAADFRNFGVLGLKSAGLRNWLAAAESGKPITGEQAQPGISKYELASLTIAKSAELRKALEQADLVVMTVGGNDFLPLFDEMRANPMTPDEIASWLDEMFDSYGAALEASLRSIAAINPGAQIVVADQYLPVPKPSALNKAVTQEQYDVLLDAVKRLRELVESIAGRLRGEGFDVRTVDVAEPFAGKELAYTSILQGDIHPKQAGYEQMGRAFANGIWGEYREPAPLPPGVPLRVIVNGSPIGGGNKPVLKNDTTFLPMRDLANTLKAGLTWDGATKTATIAAGDRKVAFTIGSKTMTVNGVKTELAVPPYLETTDAGSSTYLPLAALSRGLGYQVDYRKPIQTVFVNS